MRDEAIDLAKGVCRLFEGLRLRPYLCPAGIPSIGYGTTRYENGQAVQLTDPPITAERADELLDFDMRTKFIPAVAVLCPGVRADGLNAALLDFTYNLGPTNLRNSTLRRRVNERDFEGAKAEFMKWVRGGGRVLPGLVRRRKAECDLF